MSKSWFKLSNNSKYNRSAICISNVNNTGRLFLAPMKGGSLRKCLFKKKKKKHDGLSGAGARCTIEMIFKVFPYLTYKSSLTNSMSGKRYILHKNKKHLMTVQILHSVKDIESGKPVQSDDRVVCEICPHFCLLGCYCA